MMKLDSLRGIWAAVVTPVTAHFEPDAAKAIDYYAELLGTGCDGINLLGTTGEAMSFGRDARLRFMEAIARGCLPLERVMAGTGAASLDDAVALTNAALDLGFAAALVMPPFFFRDAGDDGVARYFDALVSRLTSDRAPLLLYNFPQMSGITFSAPLVDRLLEAFPSRIGGLKDSSNDRALQAELLRRHPALRVFPGSEAYLRDALAAGAAGSISGSVALWPALAQAVYRQGDEADANALARHRATLDGLPFNAAVRYAIARERADSAWERAMPPLTPLSPEQCRVLDERLAAER
ncbi:MAG TPA: dihydrodipicolinate synthase family protein [Candidatus Tumulicola sp.]|nr:dihydrodipicolinate synthase family protein [Candidatus Tumulicola sp.]